MLESIPVNRGQFGATQSQLQGGGGGQDQPGCGEVAAWQARLDEGQGNLPKLVKSVHSAVAHCNASWAACTPPATWRTLCGWYYGRSSFVFEASAGSEADCIKCRHLSNSTKAARSR